MAKLNTKYQWPLHGDFQTAFYSLNRFNSFISDLFSVKVGNNIFSTRDISGSLGIFYNLFQKLLKLR